MSLERRIPVVYLAENFDQDKIMELTAFYRDQLCQGVLLVDRSETDAGHEKAIHFIKKLHFIMDFMLIAAGNIKRFEDVKKYLYAGAQCVVCDPSCESEAYAEGIKRFGKEKVMLADLSQNLDHEEGKEVVSKRLIDVPEVKAAFSWDAVKKNSDGLCPVVVQDYRSNQVLMVAYMNEEAYNNTVRTGRMEYYSRSRKEQWVKGLTSGHFQYVKSMYLDCDMDTILAKVEQVGAACHTGSYSCFFNEIFSKPASAHNTHDVLEDVMGVILDRKEHPKEGSYTNYLFDKGIDKILKKCGEEATEIVIAAKNPDKEEVKYEIADFLYHVMVLMAQRGVTWDDVLNELADR